MRKLDNSVCDYFLICNAQSTTQVDAIAESVIRKVTGSIACLFRCRQYLSLSARKDFFYAFINSQVSYCLPIWGREGCSNPILKKLYKRAIRLVNNKP